MSPVNTKMIGASRVKVPIFRFGISSSRNSLRRIIAGGRCSRYNVYNPLVRIYGFVRSGCFKFGISEFQSVNDWKKPPSSDVVFDIFKKSTIYFDCDSIELGSL